MIPERTKKTIDLYVSHGCHPGSFVYAVLSDNLMRTVGQADDTNIMYLRDICQYVYNHIPSACWGSEKIVEAWMKARLEERVESEKDIEITVDE